MDPPIGTGLAVCTFPFILIIPLGTGLAGGLTFFGIETCKTGLTFGDVDQLSPKLFGDKHAVLDHCF